MCYPSTPISRIGQWCQDKADTKKNKFQRNVDGSVKAFIFDDWKFSHISRNRQDTTSGAETANVLKITWRFQKNGQNGETIPYVKDTREHHFCPVRAAYRIVNRATRLGVTRDEPLAVFSTAKGTKSFIHSENVRAFLREAAASVYKIKDPKILDLFTCHSVRLGACVALHVGGANIMEIKSRLRWRSDSFQMYLRHVVNLGQLHNDLYNKSNPDDIEHNHMRNY